MALPGTKAKRGYVLQRLTKLSTKFHQEVSLDEHAAHAYLQMLQTIKTDLDSTHEKFVNTLNIEDEILKESELYDARLDDIFDMELKVRKIINQSTVKSVPETSKSDKIKVKLPTLNLPTFSGGYAAFPAFKDLFTSAVIVREDLSDSQKLQFLKTTLSGDAEKIIKHFAPTDENFKPAWDLLVKRFDRKGALAAELINKFVDMPTIKAENENEASTQKLMIEGEEILRLLEVNNVGKDAWIIQLFLRKLGPKAVEWWARESTPEKQTVNHFIECITKFLDTLTITQSSSEKSTKTKKDPPATKKSTSCSTTSDVTQLKCPHCNADHSIYKCQKFFQLPVTERWERVKALKLCTNCLRTGHMNNKCVSHNVCRKCCQHHNTLLHRETAHTGFSRDVQNTSSASQISTASQVPTASQVSNVSQTLGNASASTVEETELSSACATATSRYKTRKMVLLPTAIIKIYDAKGREHFVRALLDSTSQDNFVTDKLCKRMGYRRQVISAIISGVNSATSSATQSVSMKIASRYNNFSENCNCIVVPKIVSNLPSHSLAKDSLKLPDNIVLADPWYGVAREVDILLGTSIFYQSIKPEQKSIADSSVILQDTQFGWTVVGQISSSTISESVNCFTLSLSSVCEINELKKLFEQFQSFDKVQLSSLPMSTEEKECEKLFQETTTQDPDGHYVVHYPINAKVNQLGNSYDIAVKRQRSLEYRLDMNPEHKTMYHDFMKDYEETSHMTLKKPEDYNPNQIQCFLPQHTVVRESSVTTKLRTVFDASAKTSTGISLNDCLKVGPNVQDSLHNILQRFRHELIPVVTDVKQMFRMIRVQEEFRQLQQIVYRPDKNKPLRIYELNTVTYGTSSAPFLAQRCIKKLVSDKGSQYPKAAAKMDQIYMDDFIGGSSSVEEAIELQRQLREMFATCGMQLRKWYSNHPDVMSAIQAEDSDAVISFDEDTIPSIRTLGIVWHPQTDTFHFDPIEVPEEVSKRIMLSITMRAFDPIGFIAPITIRGKLIVQKCFENILDWDEEPPDDLANDWTEYCKDIKNISQISLPRYNLHPDAKAYDLYAFSDASEAAFGACVYLRTEINDNEFISHLICAKTKVAPSKQKQTLARLELLGATLLAEIMETLPTALKLPIRDIKCFTDSMIVLHYIRSDDPKRWKTFVANRVAFINERIPFEHWSHITSAKNPADILSRGSSVADLAMNSLWWHGPESVISPSSEEEIDATDLEYSKKGLNTITLATRVEKNIFLEHLENSTTLRSTVRVLSLCMRYISNLKAKKANLPIDRGSLQPGELQNAKLLLAKFVQQETFDSAITALNNETSLPRKLQKLSPFLDQQGMIRVGGRLTNSEMDYSKKYPILLPTNHKFTKFVTQQAHMQAKHGGAQATLGILRQEFWPLRAMNVVNRIIRGCYGCYRLNPETYEQKMGALPSSRVQQARPFHNVSVDYCGPFHLKPLTRKSAPQKIHIAVFICHTTKGIHLEIIMDQSSEDFLKALDRFIATRGVPAEITSDNAKTFIGANNVLQHNAALQSRTSDRGIKWNFIPPRSPSFGGLHEAAVKSFKRRFKSCVGEQQLTYDEMSTLIKSIEACLNSRPITPLSTDPNDFEALTPAHFWNGQALTTLPEPDVREIKLNRLGRYQLICNIRQHFWYRWSTEYLHQLQQRSKWLSAQDSPQIGTFVIMRDTNSPPLQWKIGRISQLHPGADGLTRVVTIKTASGEYKRGISQICKFPY
ncbi:uncharacterized protein DMENIID0001_112520 [Sergentomyia squamirostris]